MDQPAQQVWDLLRDDYQARADYRGAARTDLVGLIERPPGRVIDLGCGAGVTGELIRKKFPGASVIGIEPHGVAAAEAAGRLDRVLCARLEDIDFAREGIAAGSVDLVLAGDVLEHLYNPWQALRALRPLLGKEGTVIASLPNVRNLALLEQLADQGRWRYQSFGLLDATHLRFFTRHEMVALFNESGYQVRRLFHKLDPALAVLYGKNCTKDRVDLVRGRMRLENIGLEELKELCSIQILLDASPAPASA